MSLVRNLLNMFKGNAVLLTTRSRTNPADAVPVTADDPLPIVIVRDETGGGSGGGGGSDPESAREDTLEQVRDRLPVQPTTILGRQTLTLSNVAQPLTVPAGTLRATLGVRGGSASVALASPAPTATAGLLWPDGSSWVLEAYELAALKAVLASGAPVLDVTYVGTGAGPTPVEQTYETYPESGLAAQGNNIWSAPLQQRMASVSNVDAVFGGSYHAPYRANVEPDTLAAGEVTIKLTGQIVTLYLKLSNGQTPSSPTVTLTGVGA